MSDTDHETFESVALAAAEKLPSFEESGYLPLGDYFPVEDDIRQRLGDETNDEARKKIYEDWRVHRDELMEQGFAEDTLMLVDGSFTTAKHGPNDVDYCVEVKLEDRSDISEEVRKLLPGPDQFKPTLHAFPLYVLPEEDPAYESITLNAMKYWLKWFATDREGNLKGRVWATVRGK